ASGLSFSKLDSRPVDTSVYASPGASRLPAQDSRSRWFATPFLWGSFIPDYTPVYPDDCAPLRSWLRKRSHIVNNLPSRDREGVVSTFKVTNWGLSRRACNNRSQCYFLFPAFRRASA